MELNESIEAQVDELMAQIKMELEGECDIAESGRQSDIEEEGESIDDFMTEMTIKIVEIQEDPEALLHEKSNIERLFDFSSSNEKNEDDVPVVFDFPDEKMNTKKLSEKVFNAKNRKDDKSPKLKAGICAGGPVEGDTVVSEEDLSCSAPIPTETDDAPTRDGDAWTETRERIGNIADASAMEDDDMELDPFESDGEQDGFSGTMEDTGESIEDDIFDFDVILLSEDEGEPSKPSHEDAVPSDTVEYEKTDDEVVLDNFLKSLLS